MGDLLAWRNLYIAWDCDRRGTMRFPCRSLSLVLLLISAPAYARSAGPAAADDLPRHGIAGLVVAAADSAKPEDSQTNPPTVKNVVSGGAGEAAGVQTGDTLL